MTTTTSYDAKKGLYCQSWIHKLCQGRILWKIGLSSFTQKLGVLWKTGNKFEPKNWPKPHEKEALAQIRGPIWNQHA